MVGGGEAKIWQPCLSSAGPCASWTDPPAQPLPVGHKLLLTLCSLCCTLSPVWEVFLRVPSVGTGPRSPGNFSPNFSPSSLWGRGWGQNPSFYVPRKALSWTVKCLPNNLNYRIIIRATVYLELSEYQAPTLTSPQPSQGAGYAMC